MGSAFESLSIPVKYQKAIELDPELAPAYNNWGNALERLGWRQEAEDRFAKARTLGYKK